MDKADRLPLWALYMYLPMMTCCDSIVKIIAFLYSLVRKKRGFILLWFEKCL